MTGSVVVLWLEGTCRRRSRFQRHVQTTPLWTHKAGGPSVEVDISRCSWAPRTLKSSGARSWAKKWASSVICILFAVSLMESMRVPRRQEQRQKGRALSSSFMIRVEYKCPFITGFFRILWLKKVNLWSFCLEHIQLLWESAYWNNVGIFPSFHKR